MAKKKDESKKQSKSEAEKHLKSVKMYIRKTLKANGLYRSEMSQQVEATASVLILFRKVRDEIIEKDEPPIILEKSREGDERMKGNPIYDEFLKFSGELRRSLRALKMNQELRAKETDGELMPENDPLKVLMKSMDEEEE